MMKLKNWLVRQAETWGKICNYLEVEIWSRIKRFEDDKIGSRISPESAQILQDRQQSTRIRRCHVTTALPGHHLASQDQSEAAKSVPCQPTLNRSSHLGRSIESVAIDQQRDFLWDFIAIDQQRDFLWDFILRFISIFCAIYQACVPINTSVNSVVIRLRTPWIGEAPFPKGIVLAWVLAFFTLESPWACNIMTNILYILVLHIIFNKRLITTIYLQN